MTTATTTDLKISQIRRDGGTQPRAELNEDTIADYAETVNEGTALPPVTVFYDGSDYWLADGFHRVAAAEHAFKDKINVFILQGSLRDAVLHSCGVNAEHGLRRTNEDKRRAVLRLMNDDEWRLWSDRKIAHMCHVSNTYVSGIRKELSVNVDRYDEPVTRKVERGGVEYDMTVDKLATTKPAPTSTANTEAEARARQLIIDALAGGKQHRNILERICHDEAIGPGYFGLTLHELLKAGEIERDGDMFRLITPESPNADYCAQIVALLREQEHPMRSSDIIDQLHLDSRAGWHAISLLMAEVPPRIQAVKGTQFSPGGFVIIEDAPPAEHAPGESTQAAVEPDDAPALITPAPDPEREEIMTPIDLIDPVTAEVTQTPPAIPDELRVKFDQSKITLLGDTDNGAWHRAIEVGRRLATVGKWDGQARIEFDAVALHNRLFGVERANPEDLAEGRDYFIVPPASAQSSAEEPGEIPAVGNFVIWREEPFYIFVGVVLSVHEGGPIEVKSWQLSGGNQAVRMVSPETLMLRDLRDNEYERVWTFVTRRDSDELLCMAWRDCYVTLDLNKDINHHRYNFKTREGDLALAARLSKAYLDHVLATGGAFQVFTPDDLSDSRMKEIYLKAARARGGDLVFPPTQAEPPDPRHPVLIRAFEDGSILTVKPAENASGYKAIIMLPSGERFVGWGERRREAIEQARGLMLDASDEPASPEETINALNRAQISTDFYGGLDSLMRGLRNAAAAAQRLSTLPALVNWCEPDEMPRAIEEIRRALDVYEVILPGDPGHPILRAREHLRQLCSGESENPERDTAEVPFPLTERVRV